MLLALKISSIQNGLLRKRNVLKMSASDVDIKEWILPELSKFGLNLTKGKLKKINAQIDKRSQKIRVKNVFGASLSNQLENSKEDKIPWFLRQATSFLMPFLDHKCIFRKRGQDGRMKQLKENIENGGTLHADSHPDDVAGLIKAWLRELPVPLLPNEYHEFFISCYAESLKSSNKKILLFALGLLPGVHLNTLKFILEFLHKVADCSTSNGMNTESLSVVFAPNIFPGKRLKTEKASAETLREQEKEEREMVKWLIEHSDDIARLPENISIPMSLANQNLDASQNVLLYHKKRRKSMGGFSDFVGGKIKKMVSADKASTPNPKDTLAARRRSVRRSLRGNTKRLLSSGPLERQTATPRTSVVQNYLESPFKNKALKPEIVLNAEPYLEPKPCTSSCGHSKTICHKASPVKTDLPIVNMLTVADTPNTSFKSSFEVQEAKEVLNLNTIMLPKVVSQTEITTAKSLQVNMETEPSSDTVPLNVEVLVTDKCIQDKENHENAINTSDFKLSLKKSLKRGRPNTVGTGLKTASRKNRRSNSSMSHKIRLSSLRSSTQMQRDFRKSRSGSNFSALTLDTSTEEEVFSFRKNEIQKKLSFNTEIMPDLSFGFIPNNIDNLQYSLGFSPVFENFKEDDSLDQSNLELKFGNSLAEQKNISAITNVCTDTSGISTTDNSQLDEIAVTRINKNSLSPPSPSAILEEAENFLSPKTCITMTSTPAREVNWQAAEKFLNSNDFGNNFSGEASKRDSIIKLRQTNKGRVLASVQLYNTIQTSNISPNVSIGCSPISKTRKGFDRNCAISKSVRERTLQLKDSQGFVVPKGIPSSIKRGPARSCLNYVKPQTANAAEMNNSVNCKQNINRSANMPNEREGLLHSTSSRSTGNTSSENQTKDAIIISTNLRRSPRLAN